VNGRFALPCSLPLLLLFAGCHGHSLPTPASTQVIAQHRAQLDSDREQIALIPPPSKSRYMSVHSFDSWENPYITVQPDMLTLHILLADSNTTAIGTGGMFRPVGARRQEISISLGKLAEAMTAVPPASWPYGRVVGIEEAHKTPPQMRPTVRRNMESAVATLSDLGIMVYDINEGSLR
jgi:hypothetical protein